MLQITAGINVTSSLEINSGAWRFSSSFGWNQPPVFEDVTERISVSVLSSDVNFKGRFGKNPVFRAPCDESCVCSSSARVHRVPPQRSGCTAAQTLLIESAFTMDTAGLFKTKNTSTWKWNGATRIYGLLSMCENLQTQTVRPDGNWSTEPFSCDFNTMQTKLNVAPDLIL